jgi:hypothetical protein
VLAEQSHDLFSGLPVASGLVVQLVFVGHDTFQAQTERLLIKAVPLFGSQWGSEHFRGRNEF